MKLTTPQRIRLAELSKSLAMNFDIPARDQLAWAAADLGWTAKKLDAVRSFLFAESESAQLSKSEVSK